MIKLSARYRYVLDRRYQNVDFTFGCGMHETGQRYRGLEETGAPTSHDPRPSGMRKRIGTARQSIITFNGNNKSG